MNSYETSIYNVLTSSFNTDYFMIYIFVASMVFLTTFFFSFLLTITYDLRVKLCILICVIITMISIAFVYYDSYQNQIFTAKSLANGSATIDTTPSYGDVYDVTYKNPDKVFVGDKEVKIRSKRIYQLTLNQIKEINKISK